MTIEPLHRVTCNKLLDVIFVKFRNFIVLIAFRNEFYDLKTFDQLGCIIKTTSRTLVYFAI